MHSRITALITAKELCVLPLKCHLPLRLQTFRAESRKPSCTSFRWRCMMLSIHAGTSQICHPRLPESWPKSSFPCSSMTCSSQLSTMQVIRYARMCITSAPTGIILRPTAVRPPRHGSEKCTPHLSIRSHDLTPMSTDEIVPLLGTQSSILSRIGFYTSVSAWAASKFLHSVTTGILACMHS